MSNHWLNKELQMWTNDVDFIIAHDSAEACRVAESMYGAGGYSEEDYGCWEIMSKDSMFKFRHDNDRVEEKTVQEWINEYGVGYFACTEY